MKRKNTPRIVSALVLVLLATGILLVVDDAGIVTVSHGQQTFKFPESHRDFLGASSYGALVGVTTSAGPAGPHSSDTGTGPPPRIGPNLQVNAPQSFFPFGLIGRSETTIASSNNGNRLVAGWNDADGFCGLPFGAPCTPPPVPGLSGYGFSNDGETWTDGGAPPVILLGPGVITRGDPSLDTGGPGNNTFYYANLGVFLSGPFSPAPPAFFDASAGVTVHRGGFSGQSFGWNNALLLQSPNFPNDFLDKEHIAADKNGSRPHVYVSVTNFAEVGGIPFFGFGQIEAYSSTNGGTSFSRSIIQPDETISVPLNQGIISQGSQPAVGPDGTVYVTWERGWLFPFFQPGAVVAPQIRVAKSTNNGATWTPAALLPPSSGVNPAGSLVRDICSSSFFPPTGYNRGQSNDFPRIAVAQSGPYKGRVYVAYHDCRVANGGPQSVTGGFGRRNSDAYVSFSDDGGATWTHTLVAGGPNAQFWPVVSVQPGGNVDVTYSEQTAGLPSSSRVVDVFWAQSIDGGATFETPEKVTTVSTNWSTTFSNIFPNFGDYNTSISDGNRLFVTWADGRNGIPDVYFSKILSSGKAPQ